MGTKFSYTVDFMRKRISKFREDDLKLFGSGYLSYKTLGEAKEALVNSLLSDIQIALEKVKEIQVLRC